MCNARDQLPDIYRRRNTTTTKRVCTEQPRVIHNYNIKQVRWIIMTSLLDNMQHQLLARNCTDRPLMLSMLWIICKVIHGGGSPDLLHFSRCVATKYYKMFTSHHKIGCLISKICSTMECATSQWIIARYVKIWYSDTS